MADIGTLIMKIKADSSQFDKGMASVKSTVGSIAKVTATAAIASTAALGAIGVKAVALGADAEEMRNKYDVVFSGMTETVDEWSESFSDSVGRSKFDIQESVSNLADLQQGLGMTKDESFELSKKIVELGTDLASFNNVQDADAIEAISKAMLGEADAAKSIGLLLNVDRVKAYAEAQGLVYNELTDAAKAELVYELAVSQSQNAIGDAERSSESFTNQMKALKSGISDTTTELGLKLLPVATELVQKINSDVLPMIEEWADKGIDLAVSIGEKVGPKVEWLVDTVKEKWPQIKSTAIEVYDGVINKGKELYSWIDTNLNPIFGTVKDTVVDNWPQIQSTADSVFGSVNTIASELLGLITDHLIPSFGDITTEAQENFPGFLTTVEQTFGGAAEIITTVTDAIDKALEAYNAFNDMLPEFAQTSASDFTPFGIMKNIGLIPTDPQAEYEAQQQAERDNAAGYSYAPSNTASMYQTYGEMRSAELSGAGGAGTSYNINVTGNTLLNDSDARELGNAIVNVLKKEGVR